jgi:hypothetical protein
VIFCCTVLFLLRLCLTNFNVTDWNGTVHPNFRIRVQCPSTRHTAHASFCMSSLGSLNPTPNRNSPASSPSLPS